MVFKKFVGQMRKKNLNSLLKLNAEGQSQLAQQYGSPAALQALVVGFTTNLVGGYAGDVLGAISSVGQHFLKDTTAENCISACLGK